jgi:uncharacterized protein (TIGR00251 family)
MAPVEQVGDDCLLRIKAVPGARQDQVAGLLGDRVKIRVSAPPEDGKANKAILALIAKAIGCKSREVLLEAGHTSPEKTIRLVQMRAHEVSRALGVSVNDCS